MWVVDEPVTSKTPVVLPPAARVGGGSARRLKVGDELLTLPPGDSSESILILKERSEKDEMYMVHECLSPGHVFWFVLPYVSAGPPG